MVILMLVIPYIINAQSFYTNKPDIVNPLLDNFILDAKEHNIDVHSQLNKLDSILIIKDLGVNGDYYKGTIRIDAEMISNPLILKRVFYHEIGHHFKLKHCLQCNYNIVSQFMWGGMYRYYIDPTLQAIIYKEYFEMLKNPIKTNKNHKHY